MMHQHLMMGISPLVPVFECGSSLNVAALFQAVRDELVSILPVSLVSRKTRSQAGFEARMTCESSRSLNRRHSPRLYPLWRFLRMIGYPFLGVTALAVCWDRASGSDMWFGLPLLTMKPSCSLLWR